MAAIDVQPPRPLLDEQLSITVSDLLPGQPVALTAEMPDRMVRRWVSSATFIADERGRVDPAVQPPLVGSYDGADPMGLFWSMTVHPAEAATGFNPEGMASLSTTLTAVAESQIVAATQFERRLLADNIARLPVRDDGLVATFFVPAHVPAPAVIVLGGSSGGLSETTAALLAAHGFTTLALAYFNAEHLPREMVEIPLEYFEAAIAWLLRQAPVAGQTVGVHGTSRGGELALLLGATFPQVAAVVGVVPSGLVHRAISQDPAQRDRSPWTYRGQPLPFVTRPDPETRARAAIPVERINGPVLLLSAEDDHVWPSARLAAYARARLRKQRHPFPDQHFLYPGAGHVIRPPYQPTVTPPIIHPVSRRDFSAGGTPAANAVACADAWSRTLDFFGAYLG